MPAQSAVADAITEPSVSGCCLGKLCKFGTADAPSLESCGSCGGALHRSCPSESAWLKWVGCWLLEALLKKTALPLQLKAYYHQQADWSRVAAADVSPFTIGAILASSALSLQQVCITMRRTRLPPATGKCKCCKKQAQGGERLVACNFCAAVYHNSDACLGEAKVSPALAESPSFPWACPTCFKKGIVAVQRAVLKPTAQRAAGAKKKRKRGNR